MMHLQSSVLTPGQFLPRFLLRPFGQGPLGRKRVWRFDKTDDAVECDFVLTLACEIGFDGLDHLRFQGRSRFSGVAAGGELCGVVEAIFNSIVSAQAISHLTLAQRDAVLAYVEWHLGRLAAQSGAALSAWRGGVHPMFAAAGFDRGDRLGGEGRLAVAANPALARLRWFLLEAPLTHPFCMSDNWVALADAAEPASTHRMIVDRLAGGRGGAGPAAVSATAGVIPGAGLELRLPLSPRYCLHLVCPGSPTCNALAADVDQAGVVRVTDSWAANMNQSQLCAASRCLFGADRNWDWAIDFLRAEPTCRVTPEHRLAGRN